MKKIFLIVLISISHFSCQDVIEVELDSIEPRLVIDASLNWIKDTPGNSQYIQLTLTAPFFDNNIPPATGATVFVTDLNDNTFNFIEQENSGIYINNSFIPVINGEYNLTIIYNDETYTATENLIPTTPITRVEQKNDGGFSGNDTEIKAYYTDPENIKNFYLFDFQQNSTSLKSIEIYDDEFTDGNEIFAFYSSDDISPDDEISIKNIGISEQFFEFMNILLQQTDTDSGDPFETQPATVRGNCINETNPDNYPLGYFSVSEVSVFDYTVE